MRILQVVHGFFPEAVGGVELHCWDLSSALAREHEVAVFAHEAVVEKPDYAVAESRQGDLTVWRVNYCYRDLAEYAGIYRNERIDAMFDATLERWRPDVVHVQHLIGLSTGILERAKRRGIPVVLGLHDYWFGCPRGQRIRDGLIVCHEIDRELCVACLKPQNYEIRSLPRTPVGRWLSRLRAPTHRRGRAILRRYDDDMHRTLAQADVLVTPSEFHGRMYEKYGVPREKMRIVPYGLHPEAFAGLERAPSSRFRVGYLGTLIPSKGAHVLIEAARQLARPEVTLDLYGNWVPFHGDAGYLDRLQAAAAEVPGEVRFHGRYEPKDVPGILATFDVLVVPSVWYESWGIVIREGFLSRIPVIVSDHGATGEAVEQGVGGLKFRPGDAGDLAEQIRRLMDEPGLRERLSSHLHRVPTVEENAARHLEIYGSLLGSGARRGA